jgi:2,3-bisphosphoglycerate-independent phosphoglycerate mutase
MNGIRIAESLVKERKAWPNNGKVSIVLLVLDGVGDVRHPDFGDRTPLEAAHKPNLDRLAAGSALGRIIPVDYGITPGSGPAHLGLFGYDPREVEIGRGVLEALGLDVAVEHGDVCARANFCTMKGDIVADRRAGRPADHVSAQAVALLQKEIPRIEDVQVMLRPGKSHRFAVVFRGPGLAEGVNDTDPHENGNPLHQPKAQRPEAEKTARIIMAFQDKALKVLAGHAPLNGLLVRGVSERPKLPTLQERFRLRPACIATYPMYRGLAKLAGMTVLATGQTVEDEFRAYVKSKSDYDFAFIHVKGTDAAGEDGDFDAKVAAIEEVDAALPILLEVLPDVLAVTGDHSTPCCMKLHSWHPVPLLLHSQRCDAGGRNSFTEHSCTHGPLGIFHSMYLMPLMLANAGVLDKYGA